MKRSKENGKRKKMTVITMTEEKNTDQSMAERRKIKIKKDKNKKEQPEGIQAEGTFIGHPKGFGFVEIEGQDHLVTSCNNVVEEGMTIYTNSPKVRRNRKHTVEMILSQHDAQCATCVRSGNCTLQTVANDLNIVDSLIRRRSVLKNGIQDIHWYVMQANVSNVCVVYKYATRFRECISGMYLELEQEQQLEFQKTEISKQQIVHYVDSVSHIVQQEHYVNEMIQTNYIVH